MSPHAYHSLPALRQALRRLCAGHRMPLETRARLVLSATLLARPEFRAGRPVSLHASREDGPDGGVHLTVTLTSPRAPGPLRPRDLPLPARTTSEGAVVWHLAFTPLERTDAPDTGRGTAFRTAAPQVNGSGSGRTAEAVAAGPSEEDASEAELQAVLARLDHLTAEHQQLKHELAETNSGVLALYVQLEERDEQLRQAHGQILREIEDALRPPPLAIDGLEIAVHYAPADAHAPTGGDLYDWFVLPDGTVHLTIIDALGHGIRSTRSALNVTHAVRTLALEGHPLAAIVERTHDLLTPFDPDIVATVLLARIRPATGELRLANGSHPPALLTRADGTARFLEVRGRGIGYPLPGSERVLHDRLEAGDLLVLYTDGLTESRRDPLEGEARLVHSVRRHRHRPIAEIPSAIAQDMHTVILHPDDTLALVARRTG
ncbi:translation initiation factor IF-2 [Streptomyces sp. NRRL F-4489]|uniref:PP2C family protein-serine/threonine phosphatase n=1 Tax=Streptomyces sp. NRRL F-4489 TaxID=1609095 RepID=UPI0007498A23|nr:PP2C family protein-serine/threonine phosphatase [Streptomyces sp. NRRL F-4489]KUL36916.1 translation initiation factor IF-2 [Streptomyces sp. NRRL F-4489]